ncbi:glycosyltransferase family 25 protein [Muricoccus aerilatus]|uniref:glycosyltransferase family 25 protein n=1 Tax=Muricoccus aerilatus TaxID=452982 RepID=UPI0009FC67D8|nr:glycosyltransferase family 25 protein [Roseomonas aerilata]
MMNEKTTEELQDSLAQAKMMIEDLIKNKEYDSALEKINDIREHGNSSDFLDILEVEIYDKLKNFDQSVDLLTRMASSHPSDPSIIARLIVALARSGEMERADDTAQAFLSHFGSNEELDLAYAFAPSYVGELQEAYVRLSTFRRRYPLSRSGLRRIGDVARRLYRFDEAIAALDELMEKHPKVRGVTIALRDRLHVFRRAQSIRSTEREKSGQKCSMEIYVINMDHDARRMAIVRQWYARIGLSVTRIGAVRARYLPAYALSRLSKDSRIAVGTLGCFLSHISAWEAVRVSGKPGLILEDDARPMFIFSADSACIDGLDKCDVCFVNERMTPKSIDNAVRGERIATLPIRDIIRSRSPAQRGVGCDGYILTPAGAEKLLKFVEADGISGHVDFQLLSYCARIEYLEGLSASGFFFSQLERYVKRRDPRHQLTAISTALPFVREEDLGYSARNSEHVIMAQS